MVYENPFILKLIIEKVRIMPTFYLLAQKNVSVYIFYHFLHFRIDYLLINEILIFANVKLV